MPVGRDIYPLSLNLTLTLLKLERGGRKSTISYERVLITIQVSMEVDRCASVAIQSPYVELLTAEH